MNELHPHTNPLVYMFHCSIRVMFQGGRGLGFVAVVVFSEPLLYRWFSKASRRIQTEGESKRLDSVDGARGVAFVGDNVRRSYTSQVPVRGEMETGVKTRTC